ncbi:MAG: outer membrane beta-barrel protein [Proteobacteria bacterium]|nr:outer membrane beta-barrel protein [Pseudomonadota bacterium]
MLRAASLVFLLLLSLQAAAQLRGLGAYAGIGVGNFQFDEDQGPISVVVDDTLVDEIVGGATQRIGIPSRLDDSELAWKLFGGWNVTRNLGIEVSYGRASDLTSTWSQQVGDVTVSANLATNIDIGTVRAMGYLPFRLGAFSGGSATSMRRPVRPRTSGCLWPVREAS